MCSPTPYMPSSCCILDCKKCLRDYKHFFAKLPTDSRNCVKLSPVNNKANIVYNCIDGTMRSSMHAGRGSYIYVYKEGSMVHTWVYACT